MTGRHIDLTYAADGRTLQSTKQMEGSVIELPGAPNTPAKRIAATTIDTMLAPDGSFFVIQATMDLADAHPLAFLFGRESVLGKKDPQPFPRQVQALARRLTLLFEQASYQLARTWPELFAYQFVVQAEAAAQRA